MNGDSPRVIPLLLLLAAPAQAQSFAYDGISLESDLKAVAARYPHSTPESNYVRLAPEDIRNHISAIAISGDGPTRRVRIAFETERPGGGRDYPTCKAIEAKLTAEYGPPHAIRKFSEEASLRADRLWQSKTEELLLICFKGGGIFRAEAVQITASDSPSQPQTGRQDQGPGLFVPGNVPWKAGPATLRPGAKMAVLEGDPTRDGVFTMRLLLPNGFEVYPHWHSQVEHVTVLAGVLHFGMGEKFDRAATRPMPAGAFGYWPIGMRHFAWAEGETILQLHGRGPWTVTYVNPADDPRRSKP